MNIPGDRPRSLAWASSKGRQNAEAAGYEDKGKATNGQRDLLSFWVPGLLGLDVDDAALPDAVRVSLGGHSGVCANMNG